MFGGMYGLVVGPWPPPFGLAVPMLIWVRGLDYVAVQALAALWSDAGSLDPSRHVALFLAFPTCFQNVCDRLAALHDVEPASRAAGPTYCRPVVSHPFCPQIYGGLVVRPLPSFHCNPRYLPTFTRGPVFHDAALARRLAIALRTVASSSLV